MAHIPKALIFKDLSWMPEVLSEVSLFWAGQKSMLPSTAQPWYHHSPLSPTAGTVLGLAESHPVPAQLSPWRWNQGQLLCRLLWSPLCSSVSLFSSTLPYKFQTLQQSKILAFCLLSLVTPSLCLESTSLPCNKKVTPDKTWASMGITVSLSPLLKITALSDCCSVPKISCLI